MKSGVKSKGNWTSFKLAGISRLSGLYCIHKLSSGPGLDLPNNPWHLSYFALR